jgi:predicted phage terminase large subunit-like protein
MAVNDVVGRLEELHDPAWTFVNLPAICVSEDDALGRTIGEPLWPQRMGLEELESRKREMGSFAFNSQFQQRPVNPSGNIFKRSWFLDNAYKSLPTPFRETIIRSGFRNQTETIREALPLTIIMAVDCASKVSVSSDYSAIIVMATDGKDFYVIHVLREKLEFSDLLKAIIGVYNRFSVRICYIEEASAGIGIVQEIKRTSNLNVVGVPPRGSKIQRVESTSALWESGRVHIPETARWDIEAYIAEHCQFGGGGGHDDQCDATALCLSSLQATVEKRAKTTIILGPCDMQR